MFLGEGVGCGRPQNLRTVFENSVIRPVFHSPQVIRKNIHQNVENERKQQKKQRGKKIRKLLESENKEEIKKLMRIFVEREKKQKESIDKTC